MTTIEEALAAIASRNWTLHSLQYNRHKRAWSAVVRTDQGLYGHGYLQASPLAALQEAVAIAEQKRECHPRYAVEASGPPAARKRLSVEDIF